MTQKSEDEVFPKAKEIIKKKENFFRKKGNNTEILSDISNLKWQ